MNKEQIAAITQTLLGAGFVRNSAKHDQDSTIEQWDRPGSAITWAYKTPQEMPDLTTSQEGGA